MDILGRNSMTERASAISIKEATNKTMISTKFRFVRRVAGWHVTMETRDPARSPKWDYLGEIIVT